MIGKTVSHFKITDRLGRGGMGVVYLGEDVDLGRPVALKFLPVHLSTDRTAQARFIQEAKAASSLNHRSICTIYEIGQTDDDQLFIAMAYYGGETLRDRLDRGPVSVEETLAITGQIAEGLGRAHRKGIIHRDIKPGNIMLDEHGDAVILDFGLAKLTGAADLTVAGSTLGTAAYMSPEQLRGDAVGPQTDVWSLGVVLYEMLAGRRPFTGEYIQALNYSILNADPTSLIEDGIEENLARVVERCLTKDPSNRFENAESLRDALRAFLPGSGAHVTPGESSVRRAAASLAEKVRVPRAVWIAAAIALVLVGAIFGVTRIRGGSGGPQLVAVLPFTVIGEMEDGATYAAGLAETLSSKLSSLELSAASLAVIPASEIQGPMTAGDAGLELGATLAVTGSLQFQDGRTRVTLNLVDTETRRQIDSRLVDYDLTSPLALQDQALFLVAEMLRMELDPETRSRVTASSSSSRFADDFYLRGRGRLREAQSVEDVDAAISLFELAVTEDSLFAVAVAGLGEAYWDKYRRTRDVQWADRAIEQSQRALEIDDSQERVYLTLGTVYQGRGMNMEAIEALERAAELDPTDPEIYLQRGTAWRREDRYDLAEADYRRAIALEPGYWRTHAYLGSLFWRQGEYERARSAWQRGLDSAPGNADLLANLGAAHWALEQPGDALVAFERALESDPTHARAKSNLGTAYFYMQRYSDAARVFEEKVAIAPKDRLAAAYLADAYYWMPGQRERSSQLYRRAVDLATEQLEIQANDPGLLSSLAYYYASLGRPDSADAFLNDAMARLSPDSSDVSEVFGVGEVLERLGRRQDAIRWMEAALERGENRIRLRHSPFLEEIRKDARLRKYLATG